MSERQEAGGLPSSIVIAALRWVKEYAILVSRIQLYFDTHHELCFS